MGLAPRFEFLWDTGPELVTNCDGTVGGGQTHANLADGALNNVSLSDKVAEHKVAATLKELI